MLRSLFALCLAAATMTYAAPKDEAAALENLKREFSALESLRADKLEALEKKEAARWEARYKTSAQTKEAEDRIRSLEEAYGRLSGEASRLEEDWVKTRNESDGKKEELETAREGFKAFTAQVKRRVDEAASGVSSDIPVGLEARTLAYSRASQLLAGENPDVQAALEIFWGAGLARLDLTRTRALESRQAVFEDGTSRNAWRLRLGTVFVAELAKESDASQILLRTGSLQGKTFAWRQNLSGDYNARLREAIQAAVQKKETAVIPFDLLQFKSTGSGFVRGEEETAWNRFKAWFKAGGVTLYPLFAVGFLALFMIFERLFFYWRRSENTEKFMRGFRAFADKGDWQGAAAFARQSDSALGNVMLAVAENAHGTREKAEKAIREVLLKEVPAHEKRLSLLAAFGTAAPLLGLLGTVSGLVTLFKTMNQMGGSDPKILSGGISEALINAETGLAIAIPVLLVHGWLQERADTLNATLSARSLEMLNRIWPEG
ncbi:MAG: MotA/TolQ/ExbB proton channel [Fibrobacteria bacterium]|jgi:biopolymer transport protein ExbB|nr:MotA/TolQ/ExbB proton channel [Fibrobacteria bacterium]